MKTDNSVNDDDEGDQLILWCYCRKEKNLGEMTGCDYKECQWFHTSFLHITKITKGRWLCPDCGKLHRK